jgi:hypothetical protein
MKMLYDNLVNKSRILNKLSINLLISNVIIMKNEPMAKSNKEIKNYNGKKDYEALKNIINESYKYKEQVENLKEYFDQIFTRAKHKKIMMNVDKKISDFCIKCKFLLT